MVMSNQTITIVIPKELFEWIEEYRKYTGLSIDDIISLSIRHYMKFVDRENLEIPGEMVRGFTHIFVSDIVQELVRFIDNNCRYVLEEYSKNVGILFHAVSQSINYGFLTELYKGKFKDTIEWGSLYYTDYDRILFGGSLGYTGNQKRETPIEKLITNGLEVWGLLIKRRGKFYKISIVYDENEKYKLKIIGIPLEENPINNPRYKLTLRLKP